MILFVLGVSGSGKTTVGQRLAERLNWPFFDGDAFHPSSNIEKMAAGIPLTDEDRKGWLEAINEQAKRIKAGVFACSGLKEQYRQRLRKGLRVPVRWVLLEGDPAVIKERMRRRKDHFMPVELLQSQLDLLEVPEYAIRVRIEPPLETVLDFLIQQLNMKQSFGLIGLGVMGTNLSRNLAQKGHRLSLYNRLVVGKEEGVAAAAVAQYKELQSALAFEDLSEFVASLATPRQILLMVEAGASTDAVAAELLPLLSPGDVVMDGGNAYFLDTERRQQMASGLGIHWLGVGISGGEQGALRGPAIMMGGAKEAYELVGKVLHSISAVGANAYTSCGLVGPGGAGHFAKMVHNGIEYAEMQLLAECYFLLRRGNELDPEAIAAVFKSWESKGDDSYLLEITQQILQKKEGSEWLLDKVLDAASNKGTGGWASLAAIELGVPATMMSTALFARYLSAFVAERKRASSLAPRKIVREEIQPDKLRKAYRTARLVNHHQGFQLLAAASETYEWNLSLKEVARIWTRGCIIRSTLMEELARRFPTEGALLESREWLEHAMEGHASLTECLTKGHQQALAMPCLSAALSFLHGYLEPNSPMNLIQAQRDCFGAHTYTRKDQPKAGPQHSDWLITD